MFRTNIVQPTRRQCKVSLAISHRKTVRLQNIHAETLALQGTATVPLSHIAEMTG